MAKRINEVEKVTTMNNDAYVLLNTADGDTVQIRKVDLAIALADVMRTATAEQKGLMHPRWEALTKRNSGTHSMLIYSKGFSGAFSIAFLISVAAYGGGPMALYYLSIYGSNNTIPKTTLNLLGGIENGTTRPRFKILINTTNETYKLFLERKQSTPSVYVSVLNTYAQNTDKLSLEVADETEVAAATYIEVT